MNLSVNSPAVDHQRGTVTAAATNRRRIDVSDLDASSVTEFVRSNVETDRVCIEHRGGQTYLIVEE